ncbi:hypothetical protein CDD81_2416 [Ophiocordyceps australis]|uniref:Cyanovirin-N domain-containing protein n=1 Tax=Ophiocordyceps australis TaxID=1399860 RepID=A0A2C5XWS2_9HYPO|nr:hypothetical protein CDD81_2416 [Ophiocordyceps australis]
MNLHQIALLLLALGLGPATAQLAAQCNFVGFSDGSSSEPPAYTARCSRAVGAPVDICSQLQISHCLANQDGSLELPASPSSPSFKDTCPSCRVDASGMELICLCQRHDQTYNYTSVDLNAIFIIDNGVLTCPTTMGEIMTECPVTRLGDPPGKRQQFVIF